MKLFRVNVTVRGDVEFLIEAENIDQVWDKLSDEDELMPYVEDNHFYIHEAELYDVEEVKEH